MKNLKTLSIFIGILVFITMFMGSSSAVDVKNPYVISINPSNGSVNISANKAINIIFNEKVTQGNGYVELKSSSGYSVPISQTLGKQKLKITPNCLLKNGERYTLFIHKGSFRDMNNNSIKLYSSNFWVSKNIPTHSQVYLQVLNPETTINGTKIYSKFAIYQKPSYSKYWNKYLFYHIVKSAVNGTNGPEDVYRIYKLQNIVSNSTYGFPIYNPTVDITTPGNWEKAVQIEGNPLMGGMHGYEKVTGIRFIGDGVNFIPSMGSINSNEKLEIVENSNLLNPKNTSKVVAKTVTTYIWNGANFTINTQYQWLIKAKIVTAYAAMFPTKYSKSAAYMGQILGNHAEKFQKNRSIIRANSAKGTVWDETNNLHMSMEILNPKYALNNYRTNGNSTNGETWYRQFGSYIKLYMTRVHSPKYEIVTNKTKWYIKTLYSIWNTI